MSSTRKARLASHLATMSRWQHYAGVTGSAIALVTGTPMSSPGASTIDSAARSVPLLRSVRLATAGRKLRLSGAALEVAAAAQLNAPVISPGGVVPLYSSVNMIQPGSWGSIYGTNLASGSAVWSGDFPTSLGGTSVTINGKPAYLSFVSAGQIDLQAPDDTATGVVPVVVTTAAGQTTSTVTLNP